MSEAGDRAQMSEGARRLADAIREVKNAAADREDVVVDMREAQRMRLELIAAELAPVFAEVPADVDIFDFAILQRPAAAAVDRRRGSHVAMGRDKRSYRFVRDTRMGRVVLAESHDMKPVADQVTRYIAERLIERQRQLDGGATPSVAMLARQPQPDPHARRARSPGGRRCRGSAWCSPARSSASSSRQRCSGTASSPCGAGGRLLQGPHTFPVILGLDPRICRRLVVPAPVPLLGNVNGSSGQARG